jgi:hypothetical protein
MTVGGFEVGGAVIVRIDGRNRFGVMAETRFGAGKVRSGQDVREQCRRNEQPRPGWLACGSKLFM